jgi:hypothetical protein
MVAAFLFMRGGSLMRSLLCGVATFLLDGFVSFKVSDCFLLAHKISRRHIYEQNSE